MSQTGKLLVFCSFQPSAGSARGKMPQISFHKQIPLRCLTPPPPPAGRTLSDVTLAPTQRAPLVPRTSSSVGTDAASARGKSATKSTTAETEPTSSRTTTAVSGRLPVL